MVTEPHTPRAMVWFYAQLPGQLFISDWTHTEVASALSLKLRTGQLTVSQCDAALTTWVRLYTASLQTLAVLPEHFEAATHLATRHELGIRAGDALHLAITASAGFSLATLDRAMATAAAALGIAVTPI